jgi:hypothetical protein
MSPGVKLGSKIAALNHDIWLETVEGKSHALMVADAYSRIVRRERMPLTIKVRKAYNRGCYSLFAVPKKGNHT